MELSGDAPVPAVVAADEHVIGVGFRHARRNRADTRFGHELDADPRSRIGNLQVVDKLRQVLDGIDVVVWWRREERDTGDGVPQAGNQPRHLMGRNLPTLARLRALRHLDF